MGVFLHETKDRPFLGNRWSKEKSQVRIFLSHYKIYFDRLKNNCTDSYNVSTLDSTVIKVVCKVAVNIILTISEVADAEHLILWITSLIYND